VCSSDLVGVLALMSVPLLEVAAQRQKETELRTALRQIRGAIRSDQSRSPSLPTHISSSIVNMAATSELDYTLPPWCAQKKGGPRRAGRQDWSEVSRP
jgi:type II secretory pathway pseudopilin PulG